MITVGCKPITDVSMRSDNPMPTSENDSTDNIDESEDYEQEHFDLENSNCDNFSALLGMPSFSSRGTINAPYGAVYNLSENIFLYGKNIDERIFPGGASNLLTALVAYEALNPDFIFTVGDEIDVILDSTSIAGLRKGQELGLEAILTALFLTVGDDAAYTISVNTARFKSESENASNNEMNDYFIRLMSDYAHRLGFQGSNFTNPCGSHESNNYSTVRDLTILAAAATRNSLITEICGKHEHQVTFASGEVASWQNYNPYLNLGNWDIRGFRAGYTRESGFSTQILAYIDNKIYIIVVSGSDTAESRERDVVSLLLLARMGYEEDFVWAF
ncbi:MAG: hypothetical protein LBD23_15460 [Oscillospiraceae bacterium]|nr:hypothetical protein [Oscillospiraceae bacterium]